MALSRSNLYRMSGRSCRERVMFTNVKKAGAVWSRICTVCISSFKNSHKALDVASSGEFDDLAIFRNDLVKGHRPMHG